ncbi:MAG: 5'-nucleotidase C-terminal domain-containing protein [Firmicutes bacterium]|nr:5'-nucleotidase C-terminal domain-containing protein [Bacillota bacterium]
MLKKFCRLNFFLSLLLSFFAFFMCYRTPILYSEKNEKVIITILHTNDLHGQFASEYSGNILTKIGLDMIKSIKDQTKNCILVDAGDATQGSALCKLSTDNVIKLLNLTGYDIRIPGNHDFDFGQEKVLQSAKNSSCPIIAANITRTTDKMPFFKDINGNNGQSFIIKIGGKKIGFIGATAEETTRTTPPFNLKGLDFGKGKEIEILNNEVSKLKSQKVDAIIVITHFGINNSNSCTSYDVAQKVLGINAIIDGHSHTSMVENVNGVSIAQTGAHSTNLGKMELIFDNNNLKINSVLMSAAEIGRSFIPDKDLTRQYDNYSEEIAPAIEKVLGKSYGTIFGGTYNNFNTTRYSEMAAGNLICDAMIDYGEKRLKNTEYENFPLVAFENGGSVKTSIKNGFIKSGDILKVLPLDNRVTFQIITPKEIYQTIERGTSKLNYPKKLNGPFEGSFGGFPQVSGLKIDFDITEQKDNRIINMCLVDKNEKEKQRLFRDDTSTKIIFLCNDYTLYEFPAIADLEVIKTGEFLSQVLSDYIQKLTFENGGEFSYPFTKNRINLIINKNEFKNFDGEITIMNSSNVVSSSDVILSINDGQEKIFKTTQEGKIKLSNLKTGVHKVKIKYNGMHTDVLLSNLFDLKNNTAFLVNGPEIDFESVANIIGQIPLNVGLKDENLIKFARKSYDLLLKKFKTRVINYSKLEESEKKLAKLKGHYVDTEFIKDNKKLLITVGILTSSLLILYVIIVIEKRKTKLT